MGSYRNAVMTGFICRLCSEQKKSVIHFYSRKGEQMNLIRKIAVLPIKVDKYDHLPKTICHTCINKVDMQYDLMMKVTSSLLIQTKHEEHNKNNSTCPMTCPLNPNHHQQQQQQQQEEDDDDDDAGDN